MALFGHVVLLCLAFLEILYAVTYLKILEQQTS